MHAGTGAHCSDAGIKTVYNDCCVDPSCIPCQEVECWPIVLFYGEALYLNSQTETQDYAIVANELVPSGAQAPFNGFVANVKTGYHWGYRVGMEYYWTPTAYIRGSWQQWQGSGSNSVSANFVFPTYFEPRNTPGVAPEGNQGHSFMKISFDVAQLGLFRNYYLTQDLFTTFGFLLEYAYAKQVHTTNITEISTSFDPYDAIQTHTSYKTNEIGPAFFTRLQWNLFYYISLFGEGSLGLLYGPTDLTSQDNFYETANATSINPTIDVHDKSHWEQNTLLNLNIGLKFTYETDCAYFEFFVRWENWFSNSFCNEMRFITFRTPGAFELREGFLALQGISFGGAVAF